MKYMPSEIEPKWQKKWQEAGIYKTEEKSAKPKKYILDMFPYPSGDGLHVGHFKGYVASDIISRYYRFRGYNVLHPMGWDAFGLPAENYAIKMGIHPAITTVKNIDNIKRQMQLAALSYDWDREVNTTDPNYYKWTQWIFIKLFEKGLAYEDEAPINWCPSCKTGLANEEVIDGKCARCGTKVEQKKIRQWILKITEYADRLLEDLVDLDWPEFIKEMQVNWIGKKEGINIKYQVLGIKYQVECFTTRPDTNFGATFIVLGPEHPGIDRIVKPEFREAVGKYVKAALSKSELDRIAEGRKKTGVFTGAYALNQLNNQKLPIWVSDFVLGHVGTGAVVGVPGHDRRDFEFAREFNLPIVRVVVGKDGDKSSITNISQVQEKEGIMINSCFLDGIDIHAATIKVMDYLEEKGWGRRVTTYHLRDWIFSRQRYWGEPIPLVHCQKCSVVAIPESELPLKLPEVEKYEPTGTGESPLAVIADWVNTTCPKCGGKARRETNTMPQWAGSCWYYLRFIDSHNDQALVDRRQEKYWMPVDWYIGGAEHAVLHLLYARFWHKVLFDIGAVSTKEPFQKLTSVGLVLAEDGRKMSKSLGNVVTPDKIVKEFGADTLRVYEAFMGPFENSISWDPTSINGVFRFLNRAWEVVSRESGCQSDGEVERALNKLVKKVGSDIEMMKFNTAVSAMMEFVNLVYHNKLTAGQKEKLLLVLAPFAPHMAEELWQRVHSNEIIVHSKKEGEKSMNYELPAKRTQSWSVHLQPWPSYDPKLVKSQKATLVIQVNGKVRDRLLIEAGIMQEEAEKLALNSQKVQKFLGNKKPQKVVYVQDRLINLVTGTKGTTSTKSTKGMGGR